MYKFKIKKKNAGDAANSPSLIFNLTITPKNINKAKPPEDMSKI
jgi:hypothetical protein